MKRLCDWFPILVVLRNIIERFFNYIVANHQAIIDGGLYCAVAWFMFNQAYFGGDEAAKYLTGAQKFWINWSVGSGGAICAALKMFRTPPTPPSTKSP